MSMPLFNSKLAGFLLPGIRERACGSLLLVIISFAVSAPATAMTLSQMRMLPGGLLIELRAQSVLEAYGKPAAILDVGKDLRPVQIVRWHALQMQLARGRWRIIYQGNRTVQATETQGWNDAHPRMPIALARLSRLEFVAAGEIGVVTIDAVAHKTTYRVPRDQFRAHKTIAVKARFARPVSPRTIVDRYGHGCEFVAGESGHPVIRYWVFTEKNAQPISLYAVDFQLANQSGEVTGYAIHGVEAMFVRRRFNAYYEHYQDLFSD
ncbi:MAG: hypothetical protein ACYDDO_04275 [Acidiferrobacterales bacterium]